MIYSYGVSLPGTYHIKNDIICQDYHRIIHCGKDIAIAAVADGLGSAEHADIGSKIAATVATEHFRKSVTPKAQLPSVIDIIGAAFTAAQRAIEKEATENEHAIELYDTTLTLAVLVRDTLYYGHSGDSGMIALTTKGCYEQVTTQQRDEQGRVFPLFFNDKWEFAKYSKKVSGVLLATDGMLETFFPLYLKNETVKIHVSLAQFFMDNRYLRIDKLGQESVQAKIAEFLEYLPDEHVNDDKTIVVLINPAVKVKRQPDEYYKEPDWAELKKKHDEAWRREAYPSLYNDVKVDVEPLPKASTEDQPAETQTELEKPRKSIVRKLIMKVIDHRRV